MLLCWKCNSRVRFLDDGWYCAECGQHGKPDLIADNFEHGRRINAPYMEKKNADQ